MSKKICKTGTKSKPKKGKFECKKCGLTADKEKHLCKPKDK